MTKQQVQTALGLGEDEIGQQVNQDNGFVVETQVQSLGGLQTQTLALYFTPQFAYGDVQVEPLPYGVYASVTLDCTKEEVLDGFTKAYGTQPQQTSEAKEGTYIYFPAKPITDCPDAEFLCMWAMQYATTGSLTPIDAKEKYGQLQQTYTTQEAIQQQKQLKETEYTFLGCTDLTFFDASSAGKATTVDITSFAYGGVYALVAQQQVQK